MKINTNCINDILKYLEAEQVLKKHGDVMVFDCDVITYKKCMDALVSQGYDVIDVQYSILKLFEARLISGLNKGDKTVSHDGIADITISGHAYLEKLRKDDSLTIFSY